MANGKRGAPIGNKNAAGGRKIAANVGGLITGVVQPVKFADISAKRYEKLGAGSAGHKVGVGLRRVATLNFRKS